MSYYKNHLKLPNSLPGQLVGSNIISYDLVDSTNEVLKKLITNDTPNGTVIVAQAQTQGKGRFNRTWHSERGSGIYCSILIYHPTKIKNLPIITLMAGIAVIETINKFSNIAGSLKWPNDVLINNKKVAGILTENISHSNYKAIIVGVGVNLNNTHFPPPLNKTATSLFIENGNQVQLNRFLLSLLDQLENQYKKLTEFGESFILQLWRENSDMFGKQVTLTQGQNKFTGTVKNIDDKGNLILLTDTGEILHFESGEVSFK